MTDLGDIQLQDLSREEAINLVRVLQDQVQAKNTEIAALRGDDDAKILECLRRYRGQTIHVHEVQQAVSDHLGFGGTYRCKDRGAGLIAGIPTIRKGQHQGDSASGSSRRAWWGFH
ncbi:g1098 [Coccomyxa elongata]